MDKQNGDLAVGNFQQLTLVLSEQQSHKCVRLIKEKGICGGMVLLGKGTVSTAILNMLVIKNQKREVVKILLKEEEAGEVLDFLDQALQLSKPGHGIAYLTSIIRAVGLPKRETNHQQSAGNTAQHVEGKSMFKKITVVVDLGMSDEVMDIARKAGVRGGTILHGRGAGAEIATNLFGIQIEPEKELVIILTPDDLVDKVVDALYEELKLAEPGHGILFVEPIVDTRGLFEMREKK